MSYQAPPFIMSFLSLFFITILFLAGCSEPTTTSEQAQEAEIATPAIVNPEHNGCQRCHMAQLDHNHDFSCSTCHNGNETDNNQQIAHDGLIAQPAHPSAMNKTCGTCHADQVAGSAQSMHFTLANKINLVRTSFGAEEKLTDLTKIPVADTPETILQLADDLLRRRCLRCHPYFSGDPYPDVKHGTGCAACHLDFSKGSPTSHTFLATPGDKQCLQCHYGNWVGADYHGRFEHDFNEEYRTPFLSKELTVRPYGVEYHQLVPDIHQQKGMICVDCHSGAELMNKPRTAAVTCQDCHLQANLDQALPLNVSQDNGQYLLYSKGDNKYHDLPLMRNPAHTAYQEAIDCQVCHAQWAFNDTGNNLLRNDTRAYDQFWKLTTQGSWEVESFLEYNLNPDFTTTRPPTMRDKINGEEKKGIWYQGYTMRRWEAIQLGRDADGKISVMRPVLDLHLSWIDEKYKVRFDAVAGHTADKGLAPYIPHTTGPAGMFYRQRLRDFYRLEELKKKELGTGK